MLLLNDGDFYCDKPELIGLEQTPGIIYWDRASDLPRMIALVTLNMKQHNFFGCWICFAKHSKVTK